MKEIPPLNIAVWPQVKSDLRLVLDENGDQTFFGLTHDESLELLAENRRVLGMSQHALTDADFARANQLWAKVQVALGRSDIVMMVPSRSSGEDNATSIPSPQWTEASAPIAPLTEASKERLRLQASFLSGLGSNVIATGAFGSVGAFIIGDHLTTGQTFLVVVFTFLCFFGGFALHVIASVGLKGLDR